MQDWKRGKRDCVQQSRTCAIERNVRSLTTPRRANCSLFLRSGARPRHLADVYDDRATSRDRNGLHRDVGGSGRDRAARNIAQDADPGWADRSLAGEDRDFAAGDRGDSFDDRGRSRSMRDRAADDRQRSAVSGQR